MPEPKKPKEKKDVIKVVRSTPEKPIIVSFD
jgi:hypothetical protein